MEKCTLEGNNCFADIMIWADITVAGLFGEATYSGSTEGIAN